MRRTILLLSAVCALCAPCFAQTFHLKSDQTGKFYGPFELKDGGKIVMQTWSFTIVTGKVDKVAAKGTARAAGATQGGNSILVITPYRSAGTWVFDDPATGLRREPFVAGIPQMINKLVKDIPNAAQGFRLLFSGTPFPGHTHKLEWRKAEAGGNWYYSADFKMQGWLCPALFKYFQTTPKNIYIKGEEK